MTTEKPNLREALEGALWTMMKHGWRVTDGDSDVPPNALTDALLANPAVRAALAATEPVPERTAMADGDYDIGENGAIIPTVPEREGLLGRLLGSRTPKNPPPPVYAPQTSHDYESEWYRKGWEAGHSAALAAATPPTEPGAGLDGLSINALRLALLDVWALIPPDRAHLIREATRWVLDRLATPASKEAGKIAAWLDAAPTGGTKRSEAATTPSTALDAAWAEAEAALPEGWAILSLETVPRTGGVDWNATAHSNPFRGSYRQKNGSGPTPAAALQALAARLQSTESR